ncbi:MAG: HNH endonuclease family protein [Egibacteraceae bacterium]
MEITRWRCARPTTLLMAGVVMTTVLAAPASAQTVSLHQAVTELPVADEDRTGYDRDAFRHWIDEDKDKCDTRKEVLIAEATMESTQGDKCALSEGQWYSYYDNKIQTVERALDIDHMVPLAEAWDSGASDWTSDQRRAYANDLGEERALVAVTAGENRSKADKDPAEWLPPYEGALCQYVQDWVMVKLRWELTVDTEEKTELTKQAARCPDTEITFTSAL